MQKEVGETENEGKKDPDATFHLSLDKAERYFRVISDLFFGT